MSSTTSTSGAGIDLSLFFNEQLWSACGLNRVVLDIPASAFFELSEVPSSEPSTAGRAGDSRHYLPRRRLSRSSEVSARPFVSLPSTKPAGGTTQALNKHVPSQTAKAAAQPTQRIPGPSGRKEVVVLSPPAPQQQQHLPDLSASTSAPLRHPRSNRTGRRQRANTSRLLSQFAHLLGDDMVDMVATVGPSGSGSSGCLQPAALFSSCVSSPTNSGSDGVYSGAYFVGNKRRVSSLQDVGHLEAHGLQLQALKSAHHELPPLPM